MIDLFGLGKKDPEENAAPEAAQPQEPAPAEAAPEAAPESAAPRGSHKLWAFLLVLDSVFVIVFAGAVAAKVFQHWNAPAVVVPQPRKRAPKPAEPAPPAPPPAAETPKAPEPPKPEPVKEAPKAPEPKDAPRPPKPSMLSDAPKHRTASALTAGGAAKAPEPKPADPKPVPVPGKAIKTEFKVHAPKAGKVELVGAFIVRGGRKEMDRQGDGTWTVTLYLNPGSYRYFFSVDKKKQLDPENPHSERGASVLSVP